MEYTEENMEELGDIYLQEVSNIYESKCEKCTSEEKRKLICSISVFINLFPLSSTENTACCSIFMTGFE